MKFLPIFHDINHKHSLIVGGGAVALRKAKLLSKAGAKLTVVSPEILDDLRFLLEQQGGVWQQRSFVDSDVDRQALIIAATNDAEINAQVARAAHAQQRPVNVVDDPEQCSFILPSIIDRSPIVIAVSSGGGSPVLTRLLRARIESMVPAAYGRLASFSADLRERVKQVIEGVPARRRFWESVIEGPIAEKVLSGKSEEAHHLFDQALAKRSEQKLGEVALVGAGPGDPDLLTFKALRLLQSADVVLYDRLVSEAIVGLARKDAKLIYVGKARADHAVPQDQINQMLIDQAEQGLRVVRLKGGDPFIFGRGGEEIEGLAEKQIPFQIVPGITAASGCAAYGGIPLTHRDYAQSVRFVTGHLKNESCDLPWSEFVAPAQTIVFYMGLMGLPTICAQLIAHGRDAQTPIALVQQGTTPEQKVLIGTLADMPEQLKKEHIKAPTLIIVGEVVNLHEKLNWFSV